MDSETTEDNFDVSPEDPEELFEGMEGIGSGNYGSVIKARNRATDEVLAVKQVLITDAEEMELIRKEISIMKKSVHQNVVRYCATYRSLGKLWIAMEYCEGGSVDLVYKILRRPLPERAIAYVCREVLLGLQYLHAHKRIHRDIKASNILMTRAGHIKLADFGVSTELKHSMSRRNTFIGTILWMAPETILESEYNDKADIWSLGITAIELAENGPPHSGSHITTAIHLIPSREPPTLSQRELWSPQMNAFIKRLLTKDKNIRPSAATMLADSFVQPANVGTAEELREIIGELIEKRAAMDSGRLRRGDFSTEAATATFVKRPRTPMSGSDDGLADAPAGNREASPLGGGAAGAGGASGASAAAAGDLAPFFASGVLQPAQLLSTRDIDFDDAAAPGPPPGTSRAAETAAVLAMLGHTPQQQQRLLQGPAAVLHSTRVVAAAYERHRELLERQELSREETQRIQQRLDKYRAILHNAYRI